MLALVDCNNFYVSCERLFNPALRGVPAVVGGNNDGVIIARSDEAKALGIGMAIPAFKVRDLIKANKVRMVSPNFALYGDMSNRVFNVLSSLACEVEVYSIDEAFVNLDGHPECQSSDACSQFGRKIRETVGNWTGIPVSVGIAPTKTMAKLANKLAKKKKASGGVYSFPDAAALLPVASEIPVGDVWGIGLRSAEKLALYSIHTVRDFIDAPEAVLEKVMGINGRRIKQELTGTSCSRLHDDTPNRKTILSSRTFYEATESFDVLAESIASFVTTAAAKLRRQKSAVRSLKVFLRTNKYRTEQKQYESTSGLRLPVPTGDTSELIKYAIVALQKIYKSGYRYKKAGVTFTELVPIGEVQEDLFKVDFPERSSKLMSAIDAVNEKMGRDTVHIAGIKKRKPWQGSKSNRSPRYTTRWNELLHVC